MASEIIIGPANEGSPIQQGPSYVKIVTSSSDKSRTFARLDWREWLFLAVSVINLLIVTVFTIWRLVTLVQSNETYSPDFTFCILLLMNAVFCTFYIFHGLLRERQYEIYAFIGAVLVVLLYVIAEYIINKEGRNNVKLARLIGGCIVGPVNIGLAGWVAWQFGWLGFRIVGASEALQHMYKQVCMFFSVLEFDLQASLSFVILVMREGNDLDIYETVTLSVGIPFCLLMAIAAVMFVRRESKVGMIIFMVLLFLSPAYILYKEVQVYQAVYGDMREIFSNDNKMVLVYSTLLAGAIALIVRGVLFVDSCFVIRNFGKGLRERAFDSVISERTSLLSAADGRRR